MATRLSILPYLQNWDGTVLHVRLLLIPRGDPRAPLTAGSPSFAEASFTFDVRLVPGLDDLPAPGGAPGTAVAQPAPATAKPVFDALAGTFTIDPAPPAASGRPAGTLIKKHLPLTYLAAVPYVAGRTANVFTDDTYACARTSPPPRPFVKLPPADPKVPWGKVIAALLRQPVLAEQAGLIRPLDVAVAPVDLFKDGGWLYVTLSPTGDGGALFGVPDGLKVYAARVPALAAARSLFTPVLFPVVSGPSGGTYSDMFAEVDDYDDGFAKAVHCTQPKQLDPLQEAPDGTRPAKELGVRLGWDDEQVTVWLNRQIDPAAGPLDAPMGVFGYRVDARKVGEGAWHSLCLATGPVKVGALDLGVFTGELGVETHPVQLHGEKTGDYWLPTYYTSWTGPSLVTLDTTTIFLAGGPDKADPSRVQGVAPDLALHYGTDYQFRVRLMDHTGGGPGIGGAPAVPGPAPIATHPFRRWVRPGRLKLTDPPSSTPDPTNPPTSLTVTRPVLGHPAVTLTGAYPDPIGLLRADLPLAKSEGREVGLPDPDVASVMVTVEAEGLAQDPFAGDGGYQVLYQATRSFPANLTLPLTIALRWVDVHDATTLTPPAAGALPLPTARNVRIKLAALGREDVNNAYFGADDVRSSPPITVDARKNPGNETALFAPDLPTHRFSALYLQPDPAIDATVAFAQRSSGKAGERPADSPSRIAAQLGLRNVGMTFRGRPGRRVVFGASSALRHVVGPDGASITFASQTDLVQHWLVVVRLTLDRDWTWDGLAHEGLVVERDGAVVGRFGPSRSVSPDALATPERSQSDLVFFDAVDPKPAPGAFPAELHLNYAIRAELRGTPTQDPPLALAIRLPVTTPPAQGPRVVSAGIAMSPYIRTQDYSSTESRRRAIWLEFDRQPDDPNDGYFARVLRNAPDPLLSNQFDFSPPPLDPPLAIDPEWVRVIVQDQAADSAGLDAMQPLIASDSPVHFVVPLPPGVDEGSPELFGFYTYELRVGHLSRWSTAQGRFGPPLRVAGVQHPAPTLACAVIRNTRGITVSAPFALAVLDGRSLQPIESKDQGPPNSQIWVLLYSQAEQIDGTDRRNVLIASKPAVGTPSRFGDAGVSNAIGTATFSDAEVKLALEALTFVDSAPLSVVAVELLPNREHDPLGADLGAARILRTSPLTPVPAIC